MQETVKNFLRPRVVNKTPFEKFDQLHMNLFNGKALSIKNGKAQILVMLKELRSVRNEKATVLKKLYFQRAVLWVQKQWK